MTGRSKANTISSHALAPASLRRRGGAGSLSGTVTGAAAPKSGAAVGGAEGSRFSTGCMGCVIGAGAPAGPGRVSEAASAPRRACLRRRPRSEISMIATINASRPSRIASLTMASKRTDSPPSAANGRVCVARPLSLPGVKACGVARVGNVAFACAGVASLSEPSH
jgi:hypothetical protein